MPRPQVDNANIIINHNQRYSRTAKRAVQRGEEEDKEQRRRRGTSPQPRRQTARPRSLPGYSLHNAHRKRTTEKREKTNEWYFPLIVSWYVNILCTIIRNKRQLLSALLCEQIFSWKSFYIERINSVEENFNSLRHLPHYLWGRLQVRKVHQRRHSSSRPSSEVDRGHIKRTFRLAYHSMLLVQQLGLCVLNLLSLPFAVGCPVLFVGSFVILRHECQCSFISVRLLSDNKKGFLHLFILFSSSIWASLTFCIFHYFFFSCTTHAQVLVGCVKPYGVNCMAHMGVLSFTYFVCLYFDLI